MATKFRLATLERLRTSALETKGQELHAASLALAGARTAYAELEQSMTDSAAQRFQTPGGQQLAALYRERLRHDLTRALAVVAEREAGMESARQAWLAARADLKAVEVLHERHRQQRAVELARKEQVELDDLAGSRRQATAARSGHGGWDAS